jgi:hypothetical protein
LLPLSRSLSGGRLIVAVMVPAPPGPGFRQRNTRHVTWLTTSEAGVFETY